MFETDLRNAESEDFAYSRTFLFLFCSRWTMKRMSTHLGWRFPLRRYFSAFVTMAQLSVHRTDSSETVEIVEIVYTKNKKEKGKPSWCIRTFDFHPQSITEVFVCSKSQTISPCTWDSMYILNVTMCAQISSWFNHMTCRQTQCRTKLQQYNHKSTARLKNSLCSPPEGPQ